MNRSGAEFRHCTKFILQNGNGEIHFDFICHCSGLNGVSIRLRLPIRIVRIDYKNHSSKMPLQNWKIYCAYFIDRSG